MQNFTKGSIKMIRKKITISVSTRDGKIPRLLAVINDNVNSHNITNLCTLFIKQPLMSIMDQIDPPWLICAV